MIRWPWRWRLPVSPARLRNELAAVTALRDDALRVERGGELWTWMSGAIFALSWVLGERGAVATSVMAAQLKARRATTAPEGP